MDPRVVDAMLPFMTEQYGNPHSRTHLYGWEAEEAVEVARGQVSRMLCLFVWWHLNPRRGWAVKVALGLVGSFSVTEWTVPVEP